MKGFECFRPESILDEAALLDSVGGDVEFLNELVGLFVAASPTLLHQIRVALAHDDFAAVKRPVRILKGSLRSFVVGQAIKAADALEAAACRQDAGTAAHALDVLEKEIECLSFALSHLTELHMHAC